MALTVLISLRGLSGGLPAAQCMSAAQVPPVTVRATWRLRHQRASGLTPLRALSSCQPGAISDPVPGSIWLLTTWLCTALFPLPVSDVSVDATASLPFARTGPSVFQPLAALTVPGLVVARWMDEAATASATRRVPYSCASVLDRATLLQLGMASASLVMELHLCTALGARGVR